MKLGMSLEEQGALVGNTLGLAFQNEDVQLMKTTIRGVEAILVCANKNGDFKLDEEANDIPLAILVTQDIFDLLGTDADGNEISS